MTTYFLIEKRTIGEFSTKKQAEKALEYEETMFPESSYEIKKF